MFAQSRVSTKLLASFVVVILIGAVVAIVGIVDMSRMNQMAEEMYQRELKGLSYIKEANINLIYVGRARGNYLLSTTRQEREANLNDVRKYMAELKDYLDKARPLFVTDESRPLFAEYATMIRTYEREIAQVFSLADKEPYAQRGEALAQALAETRRHANVLDDLLNRLSEQKDERAKVAAGEAARVYQSSRSMMLVLTVCSALAGGALGVFITRSLSRQLGGEPHDAARIAGQIAGGDLSVKIATRPGDQSSMLYAMKQMRDNLERIVGQVRNGTEAIATASSQVAAGSLDLSSRTEQQAGSLEETASSMEELTSTVKENADNAREADKLAAKASAVAAKGGEVIQEVVGTMEQIHESANKIVDIISVIDGIAFQTNILALNAAVEAARAGEQGRGFAVVASEVRTLAQRSANAAKEIKLLIGDSVDKVENGTRLVAEAGVTMSEIVDSVRNVSTIMEQISLASQQQTSGIEQINQAVADMDQVTQHNAALVEETAAASESMQEQAVRLAEVVSIFKLDGAQRAGSSHALTAPVQSRPKARLAQKAAGPALRSTARGASKAGTARAELAAGEDWEQF